MKWREFHISSRNILFSYGNTQNSKFQGDNVIWIDIFERVVVVIVVQSLTHVQLSATLWTAAPWASLSFPVSYRLCKLMFVESNDASQHPLILYFPLFLLLSIFPCQSLHPWVSSSHQVAKVLELQPHSFQWIVWVSSHWDWLGWFPCCPRDSQESSSVPQFQSLCSLALGLLYSQTLTSVCVYWKTKTNKKKKHKKTELQLMRHLSAKWHLCFSIHCL